MKHNIIEPLQPLAVAIDQPKLDVANARTGHALDKIALSLDQYGQRKPIVVNRRTGLTEAGNGTLTSARQLGWSHIAVVYVDDDPNTATGYALADNRLTDISRFDDRALLAALQSLDTAAEVPGFSQDDMADLLKKAEQDFEATVPQMVTFDSDDDTQAALKALQDAYGVDDVGEVVKRAVKAAQVQAEADAPPDVPPSQEVVEDEPPVDKAEELQDKWQVRAGDVWTLGQHRVICGDCREPATWQRLLDGHKANVVFTSPPYAMQRKDTYGGVPTDQYVEWWGMVQQLTKANIAEDGSFFVNIKPHCKDGQRVLYVFDLVLAMVRQWGWRYVDELIWQKTGLPGTWKDKLRNDFEPVHHFATDAVKFRVENVLHQSDGARKYTGGKGETDYGQKTIDAWTGKGLARPGNVIKVSTNSDRHPHAAAFPVALPIFFIKAYSDPGDIIVDPFLGSGTTLVAAHNEKRIGMGIERLEKYVAVILERWSTLTGNEPVKEAR